MAAADSIWVVVLTYNGLDDTRKCLTSVAPLVRPGVRILLVDNGSTDSTHELVSREFPWCDVLRLAANVGPAGGNNAGIKRALDAGAQWIVLLNNDTTVAPGLVDRLEEAAAAHPEFGILGPVIYYMFEPDIVMTDGCMFNAPGYNGFFQRLEVPLRWSAPPAVVPVDVVNGCCMMVRRDVFERLGAFDQTMFIYHDETDFCLRAAAAGARCGVIDHALIWHKGSSTMKTAGKPMARYFDARNLLYVLRRHRGAKGHGRSWFDTMATYARYVYYRFCLELEEGYPAAAHGVLEGVADGLTGRMGPYVKSRRLLVPVIRIAFELLRLRPGRVVEKSVAP
jgi:GT2 family glycosyltransferase